MLPFVFSAIKSTFSENSFNTNSFGNKVGKFLFNTALQSASNSYVHNEYKIEREQKRLEEINVQTAKYNQAIPLVYGKVKLAGNIIWHSKLKELKITEHSKSIKRKSTYEYTDISYEYDISLAIALCAGPISKVSKMWANDRLINFEDYQIKVYLGDEKQTPDSTIAKDKGAKYTPAFRGLAYLVIQNFPLKDFNNKIPNFTFEVHNFESKIQEDSLENSIDSIVMIPGSGEFVYDTEIQYKIDNNAEGKRKIAINHHTAQNKANATVSLDQLKGALKNIEWVSPVANWFITNTDLNHADVLPGVEFKDKDTTTVPDIWTVGDVVRENAYLITQRGNIPIYGGTPSDTSIMRYLKEVKSRGYKIMFYPMMLVDDIRKPWRGRLKPNSKSEVINFFRQEKGYNNFILHYAKLTKEYVDAFIIGSELVGLTQFNDNNLFPAVEELIHLASEVRKIMGNNVKISYAADWSEYHHTDGGWYNLDTLWANKEIDFIGIDAYFPITNKPETTSDLNEIKKGWCSGEGYDYYLDDNNLRYPLDKKYAWKDIQWWWENQHYNPDGKKTDWQPGSKKIWFTEIGFPSIDCATNQPNVFFDPYSSESAIPKHSYGKIDFYAQRQGLLGSLQKWKNSPMVERKFVWSWDARPYPEWPYKTESWNDGACWYTGHWLQGKLGITSLSALITDLCLRSGLSAIEFDASSLEGEMVGFFIQHNKLAFEIIRDLQSIFDFYISEQQGILKFISKKATSIHTISEGDLLLTDERSVDFAVTRNADSYSDLCFKYIKHEYNFLITNVRSKNHASHSLIKKEIALPIMLTEGQAQTIVDAMTEMHDSKKLIYQFSLSLYFMFIEVGDLIVLTRCKTKHYIRITSISIESIRITLKGVSDSCSLRYM